MHKRLIALAVCDFAESAKGSLGDRDVRYCELAKAVRDSVFVFGFVQSRFMLDRFNSASKYGIDIGDNSDLFVSLARYVVEQIDDAAKSQEHSRLFMHGLVTIAESFGKTGIAYNINKMIAVNFIPS